MIIKKKNFLWILFLRARNNNRAEPRRSLSIIPFVRIIITAVDASAYMHVYCTPTVYAYTRSYATGNRSLRRCRFARIIVPFALFHLVVYVDSGNEQRFYCSLMWRETCRKWKTIICHCGDSKTPNGHAVKPACPGNCFRRVYRLHSVKPQCRSRFRSRGTGTSRKMIDKRLLSMQVVWIRRRVAASEEMVLGTRLESVSCFPRKTHSGRKTNDGKRRSSF